MSVRDPLVSMLALYSRLPVPSHTPVRLAEAAWAVPIAGLIVALPPAACLTLATLVGASPLVAATAAVAVQIIVTGALHEDGLADCADGFWGGRTAERRLEIMRDSRVGTYGILALVLAVLAKIALLQMALAAGPLVAAAILVSAAVAARAIGLFPAVGLPPARDDGLAVLSGRPRGTAFRAALLVGLALCLPLAAPIAPLGLIAALGAAILAAVGAARVAEAKIGGVTGDVLGATILICELAYLATLTIWLTRTSE